jgi:hypothetical protein
MGGQDTRTVFFFKDLKLKTDRYQSGSIDWGKQLIMI